MRIVRQNNHHFRLKREELTNNSSPCTYANIFGVGYEIDVQNNATFKYKGIIWDSFMGVMASMKKIEMKIRPKDYDKNGMLSFIQNISILHIHSILFFVYIAAYNLPSKLSYYELSDFFDQSETTEVNTRYTYVFINIT